MKYKIITIIAIFLTVFLIKLSFNKDAFTNYKYVYEQVEQHKHDVYYYENDKLVYVTIAFDESIDIVGLFDLLTNKSNSISFDFDTKLIISSQVIDYEITGKNLAVNITEDFLRYKEEDCYKIYLQIKNTFSYLGYDNLILKVEDDVLEMLGYIDIKDGIELSNI